ncbi:hypothetical protein NH340_JMT04360 [Sarcoptes scabiei]|nr:hypothetical protein NH340_JMT04360 [Sarcoptes scabiei]
MNDSDIPIDIHTNKLLDWLISRRHCQKDYQKSLDLIRSKIKLAIVDMPQIDEVEDLLRKNVFDYYVCQRVLEILKKTDRSSKNIFGQYTSKRFQDWQEILKLYEKDNIYLAEDGQQLIRLVNYEVPSLKRLQSKYEQQIEEMERSILTQQKQSKNFLNEYNANCKKLRIEGESDDIRKELFDQLDQLPKRIDEIVKKISGLKPVFDYYQTFLQFILPSSIECLPILRYLLVNGNTSFFEFKHRRKPDSIEEFHLGAFVQQQSCQKNADDILDDDQIDFGDFSIECQSIGENDPNKIESIEIDWNNCTESTMKSSMETESNVARGEEALSLLLNTEIHNRFLNELIEIEHFLLSRIAEMGSYYAIESFLFESAPTIIQMTTVDDLEKILSTVKEFRSEFESPSIKALYYMKNSPKYVENLYHKLNHFKELSKKAMEKANDLERRRLNLIQNHSDIGPQIENLIDRTKSIQKRIEEAISKKYNNRIVNIMGGVQVL